MHFSGLQDLSTHFRDPMTSQLVSFLPKIQLPEGHFLPRLDPGLSLNIPYMVWIAFLLTAILSNISIAGRVRSVKVLVPGG